MKTYYSLRALLLIFLLQFLSVNSYAISIENDIKMLVMKQVPYAYISKTEQKTGILYEILNKILTSSGINSSVKIIPTKRLIATMLINNNKVCTLAANSPDTSPFDLIEPIGFKIKAGILPASGIKINNYSDLKNIIIAVPLGIIFDERFHNDNTLNKITPRHYINAVKMLRIGRTDAIAGAIDILKFIAKNEGMDSYSFDKPLVMLEAEIYLICTKSVKKSFQNKLRETLIDLKNNGKVQKLLNSYFGKTW